MTLFQKLFVLLRLSMGWIMFWAFIDKVFGLGFATTTENAWLAGVNPTEGFLMNATKGPFADLFQGMAGSPVVTWLFMLGLLLIGLSLLVGIGMRIAGYSGALMMLLMWLATLPPENNPFMDEHIVYALVFLLLASSATGEGCPVGKWWRSTKLVKRWPILA